MICFPSLIIGLGPTGEISLRLLKQRLLNRGGGKLPKGVAFLWIGLQEDKSETTLPLLDPGEKIVLQPNFSELAYMLKISPEKTAGYRWWSPNSTYLRRCDGRIAYFWDTQFKNNPRILNTIKTSIGSLTQGENNRCHIFIFASPSEPDSGSFFDIAYEIRRNFPNKIGGILPFLFLNPLDEKSDPQTLSMVQRGRAAFLREMERFMFGKPHVMGHGQLDASICDTLLFDNFFFYDVPKSYDPVIDQVLGLLEPDVARNFMTNIYYKPVADDHPEERLFFSTTYSFCYYFPSQEFHNASAGRIVFDSLFSNQPELQTNEYQEKMHGWLPFNKTNRGPAFYIADYDFRPLVTQFLTENYTESPAFPFRIIHDITQSSAIPSSRDFVPTDLVSAYHARLKNFLERWMNDPDLAVQERQEYGSIPWAEGFLDQLVKTLNDATFYLNRKSNIPVVKLVADVFPQLKAMTAEYAAQIRKWKMPLLSFYSTFKQNNDYLQNQLKEAVQTTGYRKSILASKSETAQKRIDLHYQNLSSLPQGKSATTAIRNAFSWHWRAIDLAKPELVLQMNEPLNSIDKNIVPDKFSETNLHLKIWNQLFSSAYQYIDLFSSQLSRLAQPNGTANEILGTLTEEDLRPLLNFSLLPSPERQARYYLTGSNMTLLGEWIQQQGLSGLSLTAQLQTTDPDRVTLLKVEQNLPLQALKSYSSDLKAYQHDPNQHVFFEEQNACFYEKAWTACLRGQASNRLSQIASDLGQQTNPPFDHSFSSDFIRLMHDRKAFEVAMKLTYLGWLQQTGAGDTSNRHWCIRVPEDKIRVINLFDELEGVVPNTIYDALEKALIGFPLASKDDAHPLFKNNFSATISQLEQAVENGLTSLANATSERKKEFQQRIAADIHGWGTDKTHPEFYDLAIIQSYFWITLTPK